MVDFSYEFLYSSYIHLMSSPRCKTISLDMMVQKRSYRSEGGEKTETKLFLRRAPKAKRYTGWRRIFTGSLWRKGKMRRMARRSGLCIAAGHKGKYEEIQFSIRWALYREDEDSGAGRFLRMESRSALPHVRPRVGRKQHLTPDDF